MGSTPGLGRSHMPGSNQAWEPQLLSPQALELRSTVRAATAVRNPCTATEDGPPFPTTWESPHATKTQCSQKFKKQTQTKRSDEVTARPLEWALIQHEWCSYKTKQLGHRGTKRENQGKTHGAGQGEASGETNPADTVMSDFWPPELWDSKGLLWRLPSLRHIVMAAGAN